MTTSTRIWRLTIAGTCVVLIAVIATSAVLHALHVT